MKIQSLVLVSILAVAAGTAFAAPKWVRIDSPHFELFTNAGERSGRRTILYFEQVRDFFLKHGNVGKSPSFPVRIIRFGSRKEFESYQTSKATAAYYMASPKRDLIVMGTPGHQTKSTAVHEYVHLLVQHSGAELPVWLNEGLAELFSTLEPRGKEVLFGAIPGRVLRDRQWLPFTELTAVDHHSPHYTELDKKRRFYTQSWVLTHMLCLSKPYRNRFTDFLREVDGDTGQEAFRRVYGKTLDQVASDFRRYVIQKSFPALVYEIRLNKSVEKPKVRPATEMEVSLAKGGLLVGLKKREDALEIYRNLARLHPGDWRIPEALGYLASYSRDGEAARRHFAKAIELEATSPKVYYDYSRLLLNAEAAKAALRKAIVLKPDYDDAHQRLGSLLLQEGKYGMALSQLMRVKNLSRQEAVPHYRTVAELYHRLGRKESASQAAALCRKYARSPEEVDSAEELMEWLRAAREQVPDEAPVPVAAVATPRKTVSAPQRDASGRPSKSRPERPGSRTTPSWLKAQGSFSRLDCLGERARLHLLVAGEPLALAILDASAVRVSGPEDGMVELRCGEQKLRPVTVEYQRSEDPDFGTEGIVKVIQFR